MKPPICEVCNERFDPPDGVLLEFVGDERSIAWREAAAADGRVGHPPDTGWFCGEHAADAAALAATSTLRDALAALRPAPTPKPATTAELETSPDLETSTDTETDTGSSPTPAPLTPRPRGSLLPDDYRRVDIAPLSVDELAARLRRFFDELIDGFTAATGISPNRDDDEVRRAVEPYASPEWREKGPASEEVETTLVVRIGSWECHFIKSSHDWLHGGLIQAGVSVEVLDLDESASIAALRVSGGTHAGSSVTVVSGYGQRPAFAATLLDALLAELAA